MTTDLASHLAARLSITGDSHNVDMDLDTISSNTSDSGLDASMSDLTDELYEICFQGRQPNRPGIPMRVLINNALPKSFLSKGDEPVALFEESRHDCIVVKLHWLGYEADSELISVKSDKGDPISLRALAEEIARCYLLFMRQRSGSFDSEDPMLGDVSFHQLYLLSIYSRNKLEWEVDVRS
ncbi:hypothetical protein DAEQUDRAFT_724478 [Daedalea quercina L-15889]|uniref:Uncharacterized protein n=1 Tax=Daedalea quercina L-15889 TaxID=1314783 RepID=A0A165RSU2_9APHY|nr:hypothetical protein DAEQUDRAFT_724478 [Daedalea quercina L-15889]